MKHVFVPGLLICISFASCALLLSESDLFGTYKAEFLFGEEELTLNPDRTFLQIIILSDRNDTLSYRGSWKYVSRFGESVYLENGLIIDDDWCDEKDIKIDTLQNGIIELGVTWFGPLSSIRLSTSCEGKYLIKRE